MPFLGVQPTDTFASVAKQTITGDGSVTYTLTHSVANANDLAVFVNNVRQEPTVAYSASGTSITFTEAIDSTDYCYVVYIARTFQTVTAPDNSINADQLSYPLTNFSSTGIDDNATSTTITIDSSENVGIGTTTPRVPLDTNGMIRAISKAGAYPADGKGLEMYYESVGDTAVLLSYDRSTSAYKPLRHEGSEIPFFISGTERMRIDSSGNVGIGRDAPQAMLDVEGGNQIFRATSNGYATFWAQYNTDPFDGATYDRLEIRFDQTNPIIYFNASAYSSAAHRRIAFQHGGATKASFDGDGLKFNGDTAAANALDDYEEGNWTAYFTCSGTNPTISYTNTTGRYVKIGKTVYVQWYSSNMNITSAGTGYAIIQGLPFAVANTGNCFPVFTLTHTNCFATDVQNGYWNNNSTSGIPAQRQSTSTTTLATGNGKYIMLTGVYESA